MFVAFIRDSKGEFVMGHRRTYGKPAVVKAAMVMVNGGPQWELESEEADVLVYRPTKTNKKAKAAGAKLYWVNVWNVATSKLNQSIKRATTAKKE